MTPTPDPAGPGQESVWAYPRPAIAEPCARRIQVLHGDESLADTVRSVRTLETSHPPTYYIPREAVADGVLRPSARRSLCEWKGQASYFDVYAGGEVFADAAWSYAHPTAPFAMIAGHVAFYPAPFDACLVDGERAAPQPGGFYGGWITSREAGPFKGVPGSRLW